MSEQSRAVVRRFVEELLVQGSIAALDELVADDLVGHTWPSTGGPRADLKAAIERLADGLSDVDFTIEDLIAEGDQVAVRLTASATQVGRFMGLPPGGAAAPSARPTASGSATGR